MSKHMAALRAEPEDEALTTRAYKVFTHDWRSPLQVGAPVFDGTFPRTLPAVDVDTSDKECGAGWNACREGSTALAVAGMWRDGWPAHLVEVETEAEVYERGDKMRAATWTLLREVDIDPHARKLLEPWAGEHTDAIHAEMMAWHMALGRPRRDEAVVEDGLRRALEARGLEDWRLRRASAWDTWSAWDAWSALDARAARDARAAWHAWSAWAPGTPGSAWDARAAVFHGSAVRMGRVQRDDPDILTVGIREAYEHGLLMAAPIDGTTLGWVMLEDEA